MSEYLHPDPDSLNAFIEGVLPEHERLECLAHLADCPRCREIVYLAQEPVTPVSVAADPVPFWKRWFSPIPVFAAAVVCVLLVSIGVYRLIQPARVEPVLTAAAKPEIKPAAPMFQPSLSLPAAKSVPARPALVAERREIVQNAVPAAAPVAAPAPPPPAPSAFVEAQTAQVTAGAATSGIAGTVTDPTGGVLPGAVVTARPVAGTVNINTSTDTRGQYNFAGLTPGQYELQFVSPGFKQAKKQIDLQPELIARADSTLELGALTDTITVINGTPLLKTESGQVSGAIAGGNARSTLPVFGNLRAGVVNQLPVPSPPPTTASRDKLMVKADSAGALFFSKNSGKSWKAVKPKWTGKVVRVESAHDPRAVFQLTTDAGSVWLSRDGTHWNPATASR